MIYFSKSTLGFYDSDIHGSRMVTIVTPGWVHPSIEVPDPQWVAEDHPGEAIPLVTVPDPDVVPPTIEVTNANCKIPTDAVEVTIEQRQAVLDAQAAGNSIKADANGFPVAEAPPAPTVIVPNSATATQVIVWLASKSNTHGTYLSQVDAYVATLPRGDVRRTAWEREPVFYKDSATFQAIATLLGLTPAQVDQGLIEANQLAP